MNFCENELLRKDRTSSFLAYGEVGKHVLKSRIFSEVFEVLSSNEGSNYIQIGHFTVAYSVTGPFNGSEAAGDLVLIQTSLFLSCQLCCCDAN